MSQPSSFSQETNIFNTAQFLTPQNRRSMNTSQTCQKLTTENEQPVDIQKPLSRFADNDTCSSRNLYCRTTKTWRLQRRPAKNCPLQIVMFLLVIQPTTMKALTSTSDLPLILYYYYYYKICIAHKFKHARVRGAGVAGWENGLAVEGK